MMRTLPYQNKATILAYTAGIIDGEGCITIRCSREPRGRAGKSYQLQIVVANTNEWLVNWLKFNYGGSVNRGKRWNPLQRRELFYWAIGNRQGGNFLKQIIPYLQIKKQQAELATLFQSVKKRGRRVTNQQGILEEAQRILMRKLNTGKV